MSVNKTEKRKKICLRWHCAFQRNHPSCGHLSRAKKRVAYCDLKKVVAEEQCKIPMIF